MHKQKQIVGDLGKKTLRVLGSLSVIILFLPTIAFADVTQNNVTASRVLTTVYQNTSGYPKFVSVSLTDSAGFSVFRLRDGTVAGSLSTIANGFTSVANNPITLFGVIPNGYFYETEELSGGGAPVVNVWYEWDTPYASTTPIDNPVEDLFYGFVVFGFMLVFTIWFFRKH